MLHNSGRPWHGLTDGTLKPSGVSACRLQTSVLASQVQMTPGSPGSLRGGPGLGFPAEADAQAMRLGSVRVWEIKGYYYTTGHGLVPTVNPPPSTDWYLAG